MDWADIHRLCDDLADLQVSDLSGQQAAKAALACERLRNVAEALSALTLATFQADGGWAADGALSAAAWVAARSGSPPREVRCRQHTGLGLTLLPLAEKVARSGRVSADHQRRLAGCAHRHLALAQRDEALLVELAESLPATGFATAARHWSSAADDAETPDRPGADPFPDEVGSCSRVTLSRLEDGAVLLNCEFHGSHADLAVAAVEARFDQLLRARHDGDPSLDGFDPARLRAEALIDLLTQTQRREPSEHSQSDRYRVGVVVPARGNPDAPATVAEAIARCDAPHFRAVLGADSEVLDIGRQSDKWPIAIRRAITLRDTGCVFPGCDRPASWCDVHHCQWWSNDGETKVDNGALLCRRHHTFLHAKGWSISIPKPRGRPEVRRPDGRLYRVEQWSQPKGETG